MNARSPTLANVAEAVAQLLWGEPNAHLSGPKELRWGTHGSRALDLEKGVWHDHEAGEGGGVLDLIRRETGCVNGAAWDWLRRNGLAADPQPQSDRRAIASYLYRDEAGALLFEVVRFAPKDFRQRAPDGAGGWRWTLKGVRRVLYRLPELLAADPAAPVFIAEGEKDCDRLAALGLVATCNAGGAGKWQDSYTAALAGRSVVVLPDADAAGAAHAEGVAASLSKAGIAHRVLSLPDLPPKGDVSDWLAAGGTAAALLGMALAALAEASADPPPTEGARASQWFRASELDGQPIPARDWLVQDIVPGRNVTLLQGDGGTGKSLLAMQLAVAAATGTAWLGWQVAGGPVLVISAEDDRDELHRRLADIVRAEGLAFRDLDQLTVRSLAGEDALLAIETATALTATALFQELDRRAESEGPRLIVLDTLADLYPANENDRAKVRQFVSILRGLAIRRQCAVLLLGHPSLAGMANGSGNSGSTAWNNSVRSRVYMHRITDDRGEEADPDKRVLSIKKANYGRTGTEIGLTWRDGVFVPEAGEAHLDKLASDAKADRVFLTLLRAITAQGRTVNDKGATTYAPKVFAASPGCERLTDRAFKAAMERLLAAGKIKVEWSGPQSKLRSRLVEVAT